MINIFLVDEDYDHVIALWRRLRKNKILNPLPVVISGYTALNMLRGTNGMTKLDPLPGIILLDINIARANGFEFLNGLQTDPDLKDLDVFVMINSYNDKEHVKDYRIAGYILKPVTIENFALAVSVLNHSWQLTEQLK